MKSSTSFGFSSSLLFFFVAATVVNSQITGNCKYSLEFQTGTVAGAGTDSNIKVILGNLVGESAEIPNLTSAPEYFEKGQRDIFYVQAPCITIPVCSITVTSDGSGQKPGWYLENVRVYSFRQLIVSPVSRTDFEFNQWLAIDEPPNELTASRDVCLSS